MKKYMYIAIMLLTMAGCHNQYLEDYYIKPEAAFAMNLTTDTVQTLQSIVFTNQGQGQTFSIWPGDAGHVYGTQGNSGYTVNSSGFYSYSYREPGIYTIVWVAGSVNAQGQVVQDVDSSQLIVIDKRGGLDELTIKKIYRLDEYDASRNTYFSSVAQMTDDTTLMCGIVYEAWRDGSINSIKSPKMTLMYQLTSTTAKLYWWNKAQNDWVNIRSEVDNVFNVMDNGKIAPQQIKVVTASGYENFYWIYAVMMPKLTSFITNGVEGVISHEIMSYNVYDINVTLPAGTDLTSLTPEWQFMENDVNLLDGAKTSVTVNGIEQISGKSIIDGSQDVVYFLTYTFPNTQNNALTQTSKMHVHFTLQ